MWKTTGYHDSVRTVYRRIKEDGMTNVWEVTRTGGVPFARKASVATCAPLSPAVPMLQRTREGSAG
jgi:hypothetical protein